MIALFLAVLEMVRMQAVEVTQKICSAKSRCGGTGIRCGVRGRAAIATMKKTTFDGNGRMETDTAAASPETEQPPTEETRTAAAVSMDDLLAGPAADDAPVSLADAQLRAVVEAIVYVAEEPLTAAQIGAALLQTRDRVQEALAWLIEDFDKPEHGVAIREVAADTRWPQGRAP